MNVAVLLASFWAVVPTAASAQPTQSLDDRLTAACRSLREVDRRRLAADDAGTATYHPEARAGAASPPADHSGPLIRLSMHHSSPPPSASSSLLAWKRSDGSWFVSRIVHAPAPGGGPAALPWPHEAGIDTSGLPRSDWHVAEGTLAPSEAADLERLLASRCLRREPIVRSHQLPLRSGLSLDCYWHPTRYHLELADRGRTRRLLRLCSSYQSGAGAYSTDWASDLIVDLLSRTSLVTPVPASPPQAPAASGQIPERFRGRWAQRAEQCVESGGVWFEVGTEGFTVNGAGNPADRVEQRGARTILVHGRGPGLLQGAPIDRFAQPLLLNPAGDRLAVPFEQGGWNYVFQRCPAAP